MNHVLFTVLNVRITRWHLFWGAFWWIVALSIWPRA